MKIVVASDSFKGSLDSETIATLVREEAARLLPRFSCVAVPMADGGEGTLDAVVAVSPAARVLEREVAGPLFEPRKARFALIDGGAGEPTTALVEMAEASGLPLVPPERRDPLLATTYGTGELAHAALDEGARRVVLAVGGSATNDGGMGFFRALGVRFLDEDGKELAGTGADLSRVRAIDVMGLDPRLTSCDVVVMSDVDSPLLGPDGATRTFGPQKGADARRLDELERGMESYARVVAEVMGSDKSGAAGAGAAGGLAFAALAFLNARLVPGAEELLRLVSFDRIIADADLCVTGEGHLDAQTEHGKVVSAVAAHCKKAGVPCVAIVGGADPDVDARSLGLERVIATAPAGMPLEEAMARAEELYRQAFRTALAPLTS